MNVNSDGSYSHADPNFPTNGLATTNATAIAGGGSATVPLGQGMGAADINLTAMLTKAEVTNLISGNTIGGTAYQGRIRQWRFVDIEAGRSRR